MPTKGEMRSQLCSSWCPLGVDVNSTRLKSKGGRRIQCASSVIGWSAWWLQAIGRDQPAEAGQAAVSPPVHPPMAEPTARDWPGPATRFLEWPFRTGLRLPVWGSLPACLIQSPTCLRSTAARRTARERQDAAWCLASWMPALTGQGAPKVVRRLRVAARWCADQPTRGVNSLIGSNTGMLLDAHAVAPPQTGTEAARKCARGKTSGSNSVDVEMFESVS
ncbi:hypothetical protein B0T16DRAFT_198635 [Cercophora newfieldiana]|uniref:Uncharacterized protein n=1 Tax=Cercophora newfieldiana TaxID=92897 RepID=A0AA40CP77_9PEZI|nr:hypothetical protein B0T16DRAFT_198635 [Cercophora newfieldiana]